MKKDILENLKNKFEEGKDFFTARYIDNFLSSLSPEESYKDFLDDITTNELKIHAISIVTTIYQGILTIDENDPNAQEAFRIMLCASLEHFIRNVLLKNKIY